MLLGVLFIYSGEFKYILYDYMYISSILNYMCIMVRSLNFDVSLYLEIWMLDNHVMLITTGKYKVVDYIDRINMDYYQESVLVINFFDF